MSTKFKFPLATPIKWPDRCAVCNRRPYEYYDLCGRVLGGTRPDITSLLCVRYPIKVVISVPLCFRHSFQMDCIIIMSIFFFCAVLIFGFLVCINSAQEPFPFLRFIEYLFLFFVSLGFYNLLQRLQPIRLTKVGDIFFTIVIKDKYYAREFALVNDYHF